MIRSSILFVVSCFWCPQLLAQDEIYVDDLEGDFAITADQGVTGVLDDGDTVTWKPGAADEVTGLIFGSDAFVSVREAVDEVSNNGFVYIAAGTYAESFTISTSGDVTLQGDGAGITILSGGNSHRVFQTIGGSDMVIDGISIIDGSGSSFGGGIFNDGSSLTIRNSVVSGNTTTGDGGGIANGSGNTLTVIDSTISGNSGDAGGGIYNNTGGTVIVTRSTISGNTATGGSGAGISDVNNGDITVTNSTLSGNMASSGSGGGISYGSGTVRVIQSTLTGNTARFSAGGIVRFGSAVNLTLTNSIVAGNAITGIGNNDDIQGNFVSEGVNFIGDLTGVSSSGSGTNITFSGGETITDLLDTALADNGGPTFTHALVAGSPAIDAGDNGAIPGGATSDQRGTSRIINSTVDIGAVEFLLAPVLLSTTPPVGSGGFQLDASLDLIFDQSVEAGSGSIFLRRSDNDAILPSSTSFADEVATITPNAILPEGIQFYVEVESDAVVNIVGTAFAGISDPTTLMYTTCFSNVYVDAATDFSPASPSAGDPVIWNGTGGPVGGLVFGVNAFTSVQEAVDKVCDGGTVFVAAGTYLEGAQIVIAKDVTLRGDGEDLTTLSGDNSYRVIHIPSTGIGNPIQVVSLENLAVTNGQVTGDGGGIFNEGAALTVADVTISNSTAVDGNGGGVAHDAQGSLTMTDVILSGNSAGGTSFTNGGGGVFLTSFGISHSITDCIFAGNSATGSGASGGGLLSDGSNSPVTVTNSTFASNTANNNGDGGGIAKRGSGLFTVDGCTLSGNSAIRVSSGSSDGGGILTSGDMVVIDSTLSGNSAGRGDGGGISNIGGNLTVTNSTVSGNTASQIFGANPIGGRGPGIDNSGGTVSIVHCTITDNNIGSNSGGGGISNINPGGSSGTLTVTNSIVAANFQIGSTPRDIVGSFTSVGVNFIGDLAGSNPSGPGTNLTFGGGQTISDLIDTSLANNGGPTSTHNLVTGSPALDAGSNADVPVGLTTDQRGISRVINTTVDIGAVEFLPPPMLLSSTPTAGSPGVAKDASIVLTFDQDVAAGSGFVNVRRTDTNALIAATITINGTVVTITPDALLPEGVGFYIEVEANALLNLAGDPFPPISGPATLGFTVCFDRVYLGQSNDFDITNNQGAAGLDAGDVVTWNSSTGSVAGLVFGSNAFTSVQSGVDAVCEGGTVFLGPGSYLEGSAILISRSLMILGDGGEGSDLTRTSVGASHRILNIAAGVDVTLDRLSITEGRISGGLGAGILNSGNLTVLNSTLRRNTAITSGGGICNVTGATLTVVNSTFTGNVAINTFGGGIFNNGGTATVINSTLTDNRSGNQGGGISNLGGTLTIANTIVAGNTNASSPDISGAFNDSAGGMFGINFIGDETGSTGFRAGTDLTFTGGQDIDDLLETTLFALDAGGPTPVHFLVLGSPAINAGDDSAVPSGVLTDQRGAGFDRFFGGSVDIGAVEANLPIILGDTNPDNGETGLQIGDLTEGIELRFNQDVQAGTGNIIVRNSADDSILKTIAVGDADFDEGELFLNFATLMLPMGTSFYIEVEQGAVINGFGNTFGLNDPGAATFTSCFDQIYVHAQAGDFTITVDQGSPGALDDGDTVTWNGSAGAVTGLTFGLNAFTSARLAVREVCEGGTVFLAAGVHDDGSDIEIERSMTLQGDLAGGTRLSGSTFGGHQVMEVEGGDDVRINDLTIENGSSFSGSGLSIFSQAVVTINNTTITGNTATGGNGGGILNRGTLSLNNCTISGNVADNDDGGGIFNASTGTLTVTHSTITGHAANGGADGGGIFDDGSAATLINTIVAGNSGDTSPDFDGSFTSTGVNFIGDLAGSMASGSGVNLSFASTGSTISTLLDTSLADNGGPTSTHALLSGSPAHNAGSNGETPVDLMADQRGAPRILETTVDIGAFEFIPPLMTTANTANYTTNLTTKISIADLLASLTGGGGLTLSLASLSDPVNAGSSTRVSGGFIIYTPAPDQTEDDSFTYEVTDGFQTVQGVVQIQSDGNGTGATINIISFTKAGNVATIVAAGIPGFTYQLERSSDMTSWSSVGGALICPPGGIMTLTDPNAPAGSSFYRIVDPGNTGL